MKKYFLLLLAAGLLSWSCEKIVPQGLPEEEPEEETLTQEEPAPLVPIKLSKEDTAVRDASNTFGLAVFQKLCALSDGKDVSFSPLSLSLALSMVAEGAEGDTYQQFAQVLGWGDATLYEVACYYQKMVEGLVKADANVKFTSANSFWAAKDLTLKPDYLSRLKEYYAAEGYSVNFADPATLNQINRWCSDKTDGKIPKMLDALDSNTRLTLINALLFKAPWGWNWTIKKLRKFTGTAGTTKKNYLFCARMLDYGDYGDFEYVGLPYGNTAYEMDIVFPKAGKSFQDILSTLTFDDFDLAGRAYVELYLPRWSSEYSSEYRLPVALKALGLTLPFDLAHANFSGISEESLFISNILQKVRIDVTEKGTEFAAVTVINMDGAVATPPVVPEMVVLDLNRPFLYFIRERTSNTLLLAGTLSQ